MNTKHESLNLPLDYFVRSVGVNRDSPYAVFLGAGASITSGIPAAYRCIWEWKRDLFQTNNPGLETQVDELSLQAVQERIDRWLKSNGLIPSNNEDPYSYYIETALPIPDDRRRFFAPWIKKARPHVGYKLLCLLAQTELIKNVWTTNFDGLVSRAAADFDIVPVEIGIDCQNRSMRQPSRNELQTISLHGDYRYDTLKNTEDELQTQEDELIRSLITNLSTHSLIVSGYSGRDKSVMAALQTALTRQGDTKIYWCGYSDAPNESVSSLLSTVRTQGREAFYVPNASFDEVMTRLALHCVRGSLRQRAQTIIGDAEISSRPARAPFQSLGRTTSSLIKSNAWQINLPTEVYSLSPREWPQEKRWDWVRTLTSGHRRLWAKFS